ncbi:MAG: hypothetical protein B0A82_08985 [Alkalinema sp. CACIAM 70d]|nr:MAG: hypothetical protein B0A82_08985 [Alkalinema sp. CACIAM 70d]
MADLQARYTTLIENIVQMTLKGQIRSKEQVYEMLVEELEPGSDEEFATCLTDRSSSTQQQAEDSRDELKQAKAQRALRALKTLESAWSRYQQDNQARGTIATAIHQITTAEPQQRLLAFLTVIDPNQANPLTTDQLNQLAIALRQAFTDPDTKQDLQQLAAGILQGLQSWQALREHLVAWIYERQGLGFTESSQRLSPWGYWAKQPIGSLPRSLFHAIELDQAIDVWASQQTAVKMQDWVELTLVLQRLQQGLGIWADQRVYDSKLGAKLSAAIFVGFSAVWVGLANGLTHATLLNSHHREQYATAAFRAALQVLRTLAQRSYFPFYNSSFGIIGTNNFRSAMDYLSAPLRQVDGTQEKARLLTLLGSFLRNRGLHRDALEIYTSAREIAQAAADSLCEVAALNMMGQTSVALKQYEAAIDYSQRALILSRQHGDRLGEAHALANLGYSEVCRAQALELAPEVYEPAMAYLTQGLQVAHVLEDPVCEGLCATSLGIAYIALSQPEQALAHIKTGLSSLRLSGDIYLYGINLIAMAEACYQLGEMDQVVYAGMLAIHYLHFLEASEWRQAAGLLTILQGKLGEQFPLLLEQEKADLIRVLGLELYEQTLRLLEEYQSQ